MIHPTLIPFICTHAAHSKRSSKDFTWSLTSFSAATCKAISAGEARNPGTVGLSQWIYVSNSSGLLVLHFAGIVKVGICLGEFQPPRKETART